MNQFIAWLKAETLIIRRNPFFVAVSAALGTAVYAQAQAWVTTGQLNTTPDYWEKIAVGAVVAAAASIYHLNLPAPGSNPTK